jgi:hypothetical protein
MFLWLIEKIDGGLIRGIMQSFRKGIERWRGGPDMVAHAYNPSYAGNGDNRIMGWGQHKEKVRIYLKKQARYGGAWL